MIKELVNRFIIWYILEKCNATIKLDGKVVRVFSEEFYEKHIREYCNAMERCEIENG